MIRCINTEPAAAYAAWQHVLRHSGQGDEQVEPQFVSTNAEGTVVVLLEGTYWFPIRGGVQRLHGQEAQSARDDFFELTTYRHGVEVGRTIRAADWFV